MREQVDVFWTMTSFGIDEMLIKVIRSANICRRYKERKRNQQFWQFSKVLPFGHLFVVIKLPKKNHR